jgi:hypothetical protein
VAALDDPEVGPVVVVDLCHRLPLAHSLVSSPWLMSVG